MKLKGYLIPLVLLLAVLACSVGANGTEQTGPTDGVGVSLPPTEDYGVSCFVESGEILLAGAPNFHTYFSQDGGLTWMEDFPERDLFSGSDCSSQNAPWELRASPEGSLRYRFDPGKTIQFSKDSGATWETVYDLSTVDWEPVNTPEPEAEPVIQPGPLDAMIDHRSGNLLLAMGHAGVLLRLPSGEWQWVQAGRYAHALSSQPSTSQVEPRPPLTAPSPDIEIDTANHYVNALVFSPDGTVLATSGFDGGIKLFNFPQGDLSSWQQWGEDARYSKLYGAVFSPDGKTLVTCGTNVDQTLRFWDVDSGELIEKFDGFQTEAMVSTQYAEGQFLAIPYGKEPNLKNEIKIFQLPDGGEVSTLNSQLSDITQLLFIPESSLLAAGGSDGGVELWDFAAGERVLTFQTDQQPDGRIGAYRKVYALGYLLEENVLVALFGDAQIKAWDIITGEPAWHLALPAMHGWYFYKAVFSPNAEVVGVGLPSGALLTFESKTGRLLGEQWSTDHGSLMELAFSPNDQWLAAGFATGKIKIWELSRLVE